MTLRLGEFNITPISPTEVMITNSSGEKGVFPMYLLEEALAKFFAEHF